MKKILNGKFSERTASVEDFPLIHQLYEKQSQHYFGAPSFSLEMLSNEYLAPGFDPENNLHLIFNSEGHLVAFAEFWEDQNPLVHPYLFIVVDPSYEDDMLEDYLLEWGAGKSIQVLDQVPPELRVAMRSHAYHAVKSSGMAKEKAGMKLIRHSFRMMIEMDEPPPDPVWPEGISLRLYDPDRDLYPIFQIDREVFQDHFGYVSEPEEEAYEKFCHHMTGSDAYDPSLWFLAVDCEEIVGICICRKYGDEGKDTGHISVLGVRRPWRRKGIGLALLQHAFGEFYHRGKRKVDLGVDANSLTGAVNLYKKAGMYVLRRFDLYEKELRPGKDISVVSLEA
jgi:ribosomal protein S18 acetylase RimI-like enzyme